MVTPRRWHKLAENKASDRPIDHLFVDIESKLVPVDDLRTEHKLWFGWACYWRRRPDHKQDTLQWHRFATATDFWSFALSKIRPQNPLYLVSHNTSYDFGILGIFEQLEQADFQLYSVYLGNMSVILRFRHGKEKIVLLDNANYFHGSLASLGKAIGVPKGDIDILTASEAEADPYCKQDVNIMLKLWQFYYTFMDMNNLGNWGPTLPSQAFHAYRHRFMKHKIVIHANEKALRLEREAYHGGRTSVFFQGKKAGQPFYKLDVNSMYPYVMAKHPFPVCFYALRESPSLATITQQLNRFQMIAQVTVNTDVPLYPVKINHHLLYPVGRFDTVLTTPEIRYALEHKQLEAVHTIALYEHAFIFQEYVKEFYQLKVQYTKLGNLPFRTITKLYLNSLYGKFGQLSTEWKELPDPFVSLFDATSMIDHETGETWQLYQFGSHLWRVKPTGEPHNSFPAIAAHVTAFARLYLWALISRASRENVYYCDTDSVIVNEQGKQNLDSLLDETSLGALKVEEQATSIDIRTPKNYAMGEHWKRKGVPAKAKYLGNNAWSTVNFPSFKSQAKPDNHAPFHTRNVVKHLSYKIYDGIVQPDGRVSPTLASSILPQNTITEAQAAEMASIDSQIEALKDSLPLDHQTVFALWDYRKGTFKQARTSRGNLVPLEHSRMDSLATEKGFDDLDTMQKAVLSYLQIREEIASLQTGKSSILYPTSTENSSDPLPF